MDIKLDRYILDHIDPEHEVLIELDRQTNLNTRQARMISGHLQGTLLKILTRIVNPIVALEIGTYTGYSAISIALGMSDDAVLHTIEIDDELEQIATTHIEKAGLRKKIIQHQGAALDVIPQIGRIFDLVFIDANKREYLAYYDLLMSRYLRSGSVLIADNVLWSGKVVENIKPNDIQTQSIMEFNKKIAEDPRVEKIILPIRDGITLIRVK